MEPEELTNTQLKILLKRLNLPTFGKTKVDFITTLQFAQETPEELAQMIEEILKSEHKAPIKKTRIKTSLIQNTADFALNNEENLGDSSSKSSDPSLQILDPFFVPFISDFQNYQAYLNAHTNRISQNSYNKWRYYEFRIAAYFIAREFSNVAIIEKIAIIGSIARPLIKESPHFKRSGADEWHFSKDLDLAVWFNSVISREILRDLQKKRVTGLTRLASELKITFAHHQVEVFCFDLSNQYLGRLCLFSACPKLDKEECTILNCGRIPLLQQHQNFHFNPKGLDQDQIILVYHRAKK